MPPRSTRGGAGDLRQLVTIQTATLTPDAAGGSTEAWATYVTAYARVRPLSSRELYAQGQVQGAITHELTIRYQSGIRPKMRVSWGSRTFQITGVRTINEERRFTILDCAEELT